MSQKTLPWPLFVNQGFYIPKCLLSCVDFKNGSCHFFLMHVVVYLCDAGHMTKMAAMTI